MIYISLSICVVLVLFISVPVKRSCRKWSHRNIHAFLHWIMRKGWQIPSWVNETLVFQCWLVMFVASVILFACACLFDAGTITRLEKPIRGAGAVWEDVEIVWEDEGGKKHKEQFQIEIKEQQMEQEELEACFCEIKSILKQEILGDNQSFDFVNKPLYMPETVENYDVQISWDSDCPWIMNWEGELGTEIPESGTVVHLTASILMQNQEDILELEVVVFPPEYDWLDDLKNTVNGVESESSWLELPSEWNGIAIEWKKDKHTLLLFLLSIVLLSPVLMFYKKKQEIEERKKRDRQQMLQDYPEIISKLMLLLNAGMSLRKAMEKIVFDYKLIYTKKEKRKAYELLSEVCREINCGVTEKQAYENIGERCELLQYRTLSALLVQHLQKGNRGMEQMLEEEVRRAQELRQQQAKILGEQASAKLLFPMTLMLLDVFIILIVPAWISFSI